MGWRIATIQTIAGEDGIVTDGDWVESKDQDANGEVRLIQLADVGDGHFLNRSARYMTKEAARRLQCTFLKPGDLLVARMPDPLGRACIFPGLQQPAVTAVDVLIWRGGRQSADAQWLMHVINSPQVRDELAGLAGGTTRQRVSGGNIKRLEIPVPPLAEQRRIVARIEALFARTRRARTDLERIAPLSSRYEKALRDQALRSGLDAGWPERMLGEIASEVRNGIAAKPADQPPGVPILRISAVRDGRVHLGDRRYHRGEMSADTRKYLLQNQDLLFIRFNGNPALVAACGMVRELTGESVYPDKLIRVRLNTAAAIPEFVEMASGSLMARNQLAEHIKTAAGQHGISGSDLKTLRLPMPDLATQQRVAVEVATKRDAALLADRDAALALTLLDRLEQTILAQAFRGELVQQGPTESAAQPAPQAALSTASAGRRGRRAAA